jgi:acyl carrier protein
MTSRVLDIVQCFFSKPITYDDNFIELGGTSVIATLISDKIEETFGITVSPIHIIQYDTLNDFESYLSSLLK